MQIAAINQLDGYKTDHRRQYPDGTQVVYSNFTPRKSRIPNTDKFIFFGLQYFVKEYLMAQWNDTFFNQPKNVVLAKYKRRLDNYLGPDCITYNHISELHDLGYLPIKIKALPEGTKVPTNVPYLTIVNTKPEFFWLTNYLETILSCCLWQACTSATLSNNIRNLLDNEARKTNPEALDFVQYQGHDFSFRGMSSLESACLSGAGHLLNFVGTDTIPAIDFLEDYYNADCEKEVVGVSVPATEHSVQCMGSKDGELETFRRLITKVYPKGIVSIVSDTWDLWKVLNEYLVILKDVIEARDGKVVIRPDSGDPVKIITGYKWFETESLIDDGSPNWATDEVIKYKGDYYTFGINGKSIYLIEPISETEVKGVIECLWDIFGGTTSSTGFKVLNDKIGAIYGDSINIDRCSEICSRLAAKGFASTNCVYGVGSYTYQYNTRDTGGHACKATYGEVRVEGAHGAVIDKRNIWKDPITDDGEKKSHKGLLRVNNDLTVTQECTWEEEAGGLLETVFEDGRLVIETSLSEIRERIKND